MVDRLFPNVDLAVAPTTLSVIVCCLVLRPLLLIVGVVKQATSQLALREPILLHLHASIVRLHVPILDSEDIELGLRLSLLFPQRALNIRDFLHGETHL